MRSAVIGALFAAASATAVSAEGATYQDSIYDVFGWAYGPREPLTLDELEASEHPLNVAGSLFTLVREAGFTEEAEIYAERLVEKYDITQPNSRMEYPNPERHLPAGWISGMAQFLTSMLLIDIGEVRSRPDLVQAGSLLFHSSQQDMRDGGLVERNADGCHLVEYAHHDEPAGMNATVQNGHLHALTAVALLRSRDVVADQAADLYDCARKRTESIAHHVERDAFPYYQVTPPSVITGAYLQYELLQYRELFKLTGDEFYRERHDYRRDLLSKMLPVEHRKVGEKNHYLVSYVAPPHPYLLESYRAVLSCTGIDSGRVYRVDNLAGQRTSDVIAKAFLQIEATEEVEDCSLHSEWGHFTNPIYDGATPRTVEQAKPVKIGVNLAASGDASLIEDGGIRIDPDKTVIGPLAEAARIDINFEKPHQASLSTLYAVELCTAHDEIKINALRMGDEHGKIIWRHWPSLAGAGCKLVIFSPVGFHDYADADWRSVSQIGLLLDSRNIDGFEFDRISAYALENGMQKLTLLQRKNVSFAMTP